MLTFWLGIESRHGNRLDVADKLWHLSSPTPYDPPLTYGGWTHARALGARIGEILRERVLDHEVADGLSNGSRRKSRRFKVVIHTSPFLRCVQTSTAISAGIAANSAPLQSPGTSNGASRASTTTATSTPIPTPPRVRSSNALAIDTTTTTTRKHAESPTRPTTEDKTPATKAILRVDAFLGEWLSPSYFELITPPPGSVMMIAGAKAELLRHEDYNSYPHFQTFPVPHVASSGQLWGSVPRASSPLAERDADLEKAAGLENMTGIAGTLPSSGPSRRTSVATAATAPGYVAPLPTFAVSSNAPIPAGYVAHARDACLDVDYQWDSMRAPYDWGDGGEYGEEWTAMHRRFRSGIQKLMDWYSTSDRPADMVAAPARRMANGTGENSDPAEDSATTAEEAEESGGDDGDDGDVETVVILVSHSAGCNALIGAITHQPVLMDVGMASLTMAARKPGRETLHRAPSDDFSPTITAPDDDQRSMESSSTAPVPGTMAIHEYYDLKMFASTDHLRSIPPTPGASRTSSLANVFGSYRGRHANSLSSALGGGFPYADGGASRSSSASAALGTAATARRGSGVALSGLSRTPSTGLWSPAVRAADDEVLLEDDDDDDVMELGPVHGHGPNAADHVIDTRDLSAGRGEERGRTVASPTTYGERVGAAPRPQLGHGAGGLWGSPKAAAAVGPVERLREGTAGSQKRRWTVNERA